MNSPEPIRIVLAKTGLDGHDRGIRLVGRALRDAGMEVIYLKFVSLDVLADAVVEEDADAIGVSMLNGSHRIVLPKLVEALEERGCTDVAVIAGGIIPTQDFQMLKDGGVDSVFGPGTPTDEIVTTIRELVGSRRQSVG